MALTIRCLIEVAHTFNTAKGDGVGRDLLRKFFGGDWKDREIQEALSRSMPATV